MKRMIDQTSPAGFGIYIHWPFCRSKCPYCDFNSHVSASIDEAAWMEALTAEMRYAASLTPNQRVSSVFFGGGTPSLMSGKLVGHLIDKISEFWRISNNLEITLEANPTSVEAAKLADFKVAGVNRLSIGVQSFRDDQLKFLGRQHSAGEAQETIKLAQKYFDRFSFDLIYARPEQRLEDWKAELEEALDYAVGHLSLYQLTIERGTAFHTQYQRGDFDIPAESDAARLYELTQELLDKANMPAYEISNHAKLGQECLHNKIYWQYGDYVGIGPGAHGRLKTQAGQKIGTRAHRAPQAWLQRVAEHGHGYHEFEEIGQDQQIDEILMMGLRLAEGVKLETFNALTGKDLADLFSNPKLKPLYEEGLLNPIDTHLSLTQQGRTRLNGVLSYLLA